MPDSTIYAEGSGNPDDATVFQGDHTVDWATARGTSLTAGIVHRDFDTSYASAIFSRYLIGRGGAAMWVNRRVYMGFDVSGESGTVDSATVKVYMDNVGDTGANARIAMVQATTLAGSTADYGNCFSSGTTLGTSMIDNFVEISTTAGYHDFELNSDGISALNSKIGSGLFEVCFMSHKFDYSNEDPDDGSGGSGDYTTISVRYSEYSSTSSDPKIEIDYAAVAAVTHNATFFGSNF